MCRLNLLEKITYKNHFALRTNFGFILVCSLFKKPIPRSVFLLSTTFIAFFSYWKISIHIRLSDYTTGCNTSWCRNNCSQCCFRRFKFIHFCLSGMKFGLVAETLTIIGNSLLRKISFHESIADTNDLHKNRWLDHNNNLFKPILSQ